MDFPFGMTVYRLRAAAVPDPYSPSETVPDWASPNVLPIPGAFVAQSSTSMLRTATREQALEAKSLFDPISADVRKGDRILVGSFTPELPDGVTSIPVGTEPVGSVYTIDGIPPDADTNPWTGWSPPREIPLQRWED